MMRFFDKASARSMIIVPLAVALVPVLLFSCKARMEKKLAAQAAAAANQPPAVVIEDVRQQTVNIPSESVARTTADQSVEIRARVEGILLEASFEEGKPVTRDQVLFRIDPAVYEASLQSANAQLAKAKADLQQAKEQVSLKASEAQVKQADASLVKANQDVTRLEPLVREEAVPQQDLDSAVAKQKGAQADLEAAEANRDNTALSQKVGIEQAEAAIESAKAAVAKAELDLSYTTIKSPIDGIIGRREVSVGNLVGRGEPTLLATVSTTDPMRVDFSISERDYLWLAKRHIEEGDKQPPASLELILADGSVYPQPGRVIMLERGLDPTTATIPISASFPNPDSLLRPGLFARVRIPARTIENALLIPQRAVMELQGAKTVLVVDASNTVSVRTIAVADRFENCFVVTDGVKAGERIIVEGQQKAKPGKTVTPAAPISEEKTAADGAAEGK